MNGSILDWPAAASSGAKRAGGKGWQLGMLHRYGVAVPEGFTVAVEAAAGRRPGDAVPDALAEALTTELAQRGWLDAPLAVRSSAPMEDSQAASFAGIYKSCLNVRGPDALTSAVQTVWDSLWTPQALAYRQRVGAEETDAGMAVVVMPLLPAVAAGIAFTCDPVTGRMDRMLIHANWGLGESLVSGQIEGDEYRLHIDPRTDGLSLIDSRVGEKRRFTQVLPDGGTALTQTCDERAGRAVLSEEQVVNLAERVRDAAAALDFAHNGYDLEWVFDGQRFWIVQARPITARARWTYAAIADQPVYWSRGNTSEILPAPVSAADWRLFQTMVGRMLTRGYELAGYPVLPGALRARLSHGRLYLQASLMQWEGFDALGIAPATLNQLMGGRQGQITVPSLDLGTRWARVKRLLRYLRNATRERRGADAAIATARARARAWADASLPTEPTALAGRLRTQWAALHGADDLFFLQGSGGGTLFNLLQLIEKHCPGEGNALTAALMAGGAPSVTAQQGHALLALAKTAAGDTAALAWLRSPGRVGARWAQALPESSAFRQGFADFLARYGHRGVYETYLRNPSWREAPDYLLDSVLNLLESDPAAVADRQRHVVGDAWARVRRALPLWARPLLGKLVKTSVTECNQREAARSALVAGLKALRRTLLAVGERFTGADGLDRADDVFNLTEAEVIALCEGRLAPVAAGHRAADRCRQLAQWTQEREPAVIVEGAEATASSTASDQGGDSTADTWQGTAVSAGHARGRVRIAHRPEDGLAMEAGDILVAPSTDPAWTPLFLKAGGLILETGGYLSHGAIVAREFGIPAVANLPGILDQLAEGESVEVDGRRGVIRVSHMAPSENLMRPNPPGTSR